MTTSLTLPSSAAAAVALSAFRPIPNVDETMYRVNAINALAPVSGEACFTFFKAQISSDRTRIKVPIDVAASGLTAAYAALYWSDGTTITQLAVSVNDFTAVNAITAGNYWTATIASSAVVAGGDYAVGIIFVGTTPPGIRGSFVDFYRDLDAPAYCGVKFGQTTLTTPITISGLSKDFAFRALVAP